MIKSELGLILQDIHTGDFKKYNAILNEVSLKSYWENYTGSITDIARHELSSGTIIRWKWTNKKSEFGREGLQLISINERNI